MFFSQYTLLAWFLPLLAVPLLIHLLNKKFPKTLPFSSVEQIRKSLARRSGLFRWRHLLLAFLRTLALALLLFAFLKPVLGKFGANPNQGGTRHVLVLFDHSLSMETRDGSLSGRNRGLMEVEKIFATLGADDLVNIRAVGRNAVASFNGFSPDHSGALNYLRALGPGLGNADFNKAIQVSINDFVGIKGTQEIYFISDFQRASWGESDLSRLPDGVRVFLVNVAPTARANRGIVATRLPPGPVSVGDTLPLEISVGNFSGEGGASDVEVILDGKKSFQTNVALRPWSVSKAVVPIPVGASGIRTLEVKIPEDDLPEDDRRFLSVTVQEKEEVVVVSDGTGGEQQNSGFFLLRALNPYEGMAGTLLPRPVASSGLSLAQLSTTRKLFLTNVDLIGPEQAKLLTDFLSGGGGILYFCDGKFDAENLAMLDKAAGGTLVPFTLGQRQSAGETSGGAQQILRGDFKSKYLRLFRGTQRQNLSLLEFYEYSHARPTGHGKVLLSYSDGTPAMGVAHSGLGVLLICNFSVNEIASNMARQRLFPAWIHDLVKTLGSDESGERPLEVGDTVQAEIWLPEIRANAVTAPDGRSVRTEREMRQGRFEVSFVADQQGIYRLEEEGALYAFAVNTPPDESDLRPVDVDLLNRRLGEKQQAHFIEGQDDYEALNRGEPLFLYFIFGVLGVLSVELLALLFFKPSAPRVRHE